MKVWTLTIEHRHGEDTSVYASEEAAHSALIDWVRSWWDNEVPQTGDDYDEIPDDDALAIDRYFEIVESEDYMLGETDVLGDASWTKFTAAELDSLIATAAEVVHDGLDSLSSSQVKTAERAWALLNPEEDEA